MLNIILGLIGPLLGKIADGVFRTSDDVALWVRLAGNLAARIPAIMDKHGTDVKFTDIDFQSLKAPDWDDV